MGAPKWFWAVLACCAVIATGVFVWGTIFPAEQSVRVRERPSSSFIKD